MLLSSDVVTNARPKFFSGQSFSICYWNLKSISMHNYTKISAFFDIICVSETYLDLETCTDDQSLEIPDYYMLHTD